jgi:CRISPR-associated protein Csb1
MRLEGLQEIVRSSSALRYRARLQPAGGQGDKVFPPTYEGGVYAEEIRVIGGNRVPCIHLDSVQSQANRMELALLEAVRAGEITLPLVEVDFGRKSAELAEVGTISSLEAPHRLADAILRDSCRDGVRFRELPEGKLLDESSLQNASGLFEVSPTSLLFGLWDSTGPKGGLGVKFQRAIVSELVAIDVEKGVKSSSRIDPLGIMVNAGPVRLDPKTGLLVLEGKDGSSKAAKTPGKEGKPSEVNHGNVTPSLSTTNGGVTFAHALQTVVLSLPALRRLRFPADGKHDPKADLAARTTLAALGLCATALSLSKGCDLRSRCLLVPEGPGIWEIVHADGKTEQFSISAKEACELLTGAVKAATAAGLGWREKPLTLVPSDGLAELVLRSRKLAMQPKAGD